MSKHVNANQMLVQKSLNFVKGEQSNSLFNGILYVLLIM